MVRAVVAVVVAVVVTGGGEHCYGPRLIGSPPYMPRGWRER